MFPFLFLILEVCVFFSLFFLCQSGRFYQSCKNLFKESAFSFIDFLIFSFDNFCSHIYNLLLLLALDLFCFFPQ